MRKVLFPVVIAATLLVTIFGAGRWIVFAATETFPSRPITLIVPFPPGGGLDVTARILNEPLAKALGRPVVIENMGGAAGSIGVGRVAHAAPDGYTIGIGMWGTHVLNPAMYHLDYDVVSDFAPIGLLATAPQMIVGKKGLPANYLKGLIAWLKANPDKALMATAGVGSVGHVLGVFFQKETGTEFRFVPYRGLGPATQALLAGEVDMLITTPSAALQQVRAGNIMAYAITDKQRLATAPEIPTVDEAGVPGLYAPNGYALWAPKGTPQETIAKLNAATVTALAQPDVRTKFAAAGLNLFPRDQETPEALRNLQEADIKKWWPIVKSADINIE